MKEISDEIIDLAMDKCVDIHKWPPEISEFKQICLGLKGSSLIPWSDEVIKLSYISNNYKTNESFEKIIDEGAKVCKKLKEIYPELSWMKIAIKFTELKKKTKIYYERFSNFHHLVELNKYSIEDISDALNIEVIK